MTSRKDYEAAKERVERFMSGVAAWDVYPDRATALSISDLRADLNLIAEYEGRVRSEAYYTADSEHLNAEQQRVLAEQRVAIRRLIQDEHHPAPPAISRRDYMVGQALAGTLTHHGVDPGFDSVVHAINIADAVLKEMGE
jgi:hypothetical protein